MSNSQNSIIPLVMLIFRQKSFQFCTPYLKTQQPVLPANAEGIPTMNNRKVRVSGVVISAIKADIVKPNATPPPVKI